MNTNETNMNAQSPTSVAVPSAAPVAAPPTPVVAPIATINVTPGGAVVNQVAAKPRKAGKKNKAPSPAVKN